MRALKINDTLNDVLSSFTSNIQELDQNWVVVFLSLKLIKIYSSNKNAKVIMVGIKNLKNCHTQILTKIAT